MPTMKREYSKTEISLVESFIELFIIIPNPQLRDKKDEIMKMALEELDKRLDNK